MSSSRLGGLFSPEQKHTELRTPLSAQAFCSSQFHSSVAHGWEKKSKMPPRPSQTCCLGSLPRPSFPSYYETLHFTTLYSSALHF